MSDSETDVSERSDLMAAIRTEIQGWGLSQAAAAKRLGLTRTRMNDLMQGRVHEFSLEELMGLALGAGMGLQFDLKKLLNQIPKQ